MNQYRLRTIKDIFDEIPEDRIEACMKELTATLIIAKGVQTLGGIIAKSKGSDPAKAAVLQEEFIWTDDGKAESNIRLEFVPKAK